MQECTQGFESLSLRHEKSLNKGLFHFSKILPDAGEKGQNGHMFIKLFIKGYFELEQGSFRRKNKLKIRI